VFRFDAPEVLFEAGDGAAVAGDLVGPSALFGVVARTVMSASWSAMAGANSWAGAKLSHCSQMLE
jgi:hypothetical protein